MAFWLAKSGEPHEIVFFFFNDPATTEIYTLSLHDALPIRCTCAAQVITRPKPPLARMVSQWNSSSDRRPDRKSTRLNSSHGYISYAVFCLKKKKLTASGADQHARTAVKSA